jgi:putative transcriptional regulator
MKASKIKIEKPKMAEGLIKGLQQAIQMEKGKSIGRKVVLFKPAPIWTKKSIQNLRKKVFRMSQPEFASVLNVKTTTVRAWEQGRRNPDGAAARLLEILYKSKDLHILGIE